MVDRHETLTTPQRWDATFDASDATPSADRGEGPVPTLEELAPRGLGAALLELVFLVGLGGVFLVNSMVAVVEPAGFVELVAASPMGVIVGEGAWIAPVIAVNDFLIGTAVIATYRLRALRAPVLAWAGMWLLLVTVLKLTTLG